MIKRNFLSIPVKKIQITLPVLMECEEKNKLI